MANIKLGRNCIVSFFSTFGKVLRNNFERFYGNGGKACAWLIYKSAAELTVRLTPHRHPRVARSGAEAKRTPERTNRTKPIESAAARSRPR